MNILTKLIKDDMKPALGVTEPGAIAFAAAKAKSYCKGEIVSVNVAMNSGMYKNAFTCGIPNSDQFGAAFSAALGAAGGDAEKGLEVLDGIGEAEDAAAKKLMAEGKVKVTLSGITSRIYICATVKTESDEAEVTIQDSHTHITKIIVNGKTEYEEEVKLTEEGAAEEVPEIHKYTLAQLVDYAKTVPFEEISFIADAYKTNLELYEEGKNSPRTSFLPMLLKQNGGKEISESARDSAVLLCGGAIEARVIGLSKPAMSITGSGAHGIIATMPLYAEAKVKGYSDEKLYRATALSYLVCMYIKEYSGKLSAFCGCAIAAGTGMGCGLAFLRDEDVDVMAGLIRNMAGSITGMICDGGNQGCAMKGISATEVVYRSLSLAENGVSIDGIHGVCGLTPEDTMRNMGLIASPGMVGTEKTIVDIFEAK